MPPAHCLGNPPTPTITSMDMLLIREEQLPLSCHPAVITSCPLDAAPFRSEIHLDGVASTKSVIHLSSSPLFVASLFLSALDKIREGRHSAAEISRLPNMARGLKGRRNVEVAVSCDRFGRSSRSMTGDPGRDIKCDTVLVQNGCFVFESSPLP